MGDSLSWRTVASAGVPALRRRANPLSGLTGLVLTVATGVILMAAALVAVVFAATLAVVMALATALLGLSALVWRMRRRPARLALSGRGPGHAWIAYRWDAR